MSKKCSIYTGKIEIVYKLYIPKVDISEMNHVKLSLLYVPAILMNEEKVSMG